MTFHPLQDRVLVKPQDAETMHGDIIIPDVAQEKPTKATVVAVGPGSRDQNGQTHEPGVRVGDLILFSKFGGQAIDVDGEELLVLREGDVMGYYTDATGAR